MAETRTQEFVGTIQKCPSCGQVLKAMQAVCPACGHEIIGVKANMSVREFFDLYQKERSDRNKVNLINNYPLPNAKEDILEFAILAGQQVKALAKMQATKTGAMGLYGNTQALQNGVFGVYKQAMFGNGGGEEKVSQEEFLEVWKAKLEQVFLKAELSFGDDRNGYDQLNKILSEAIEAVNELENKKSKTQKTVKKNYVATWIFVVVVMGALYGWAGVTLIKSNSESKKEPQRLEALFVEIQNDIAAGDYDAAEMKLPDLECSATLINQTEKDKWHDKREALEKQIERKRGE